MIRILIIDNFDSFTFNLVQQIVIILKKIYKNSFEIIVKRNNEIKATDVKKLKPDYIIISPGPKTPKNAGISKSLIKKHYKDFPILGVCLGMQCINEVFGGKTIHSPLPVHGKTSPLEHTGKNLFKGVPQHIDIARYHSLIIGDIPADLEVTAWSKDKIPMAIKHKKYPIYGVQFHPESFMTKYGDKIMRNFLTMNFS
jgi:anthranilate synthase component 2